MSNKQNASHLLPQPIPISMQRWEEGIPPLASISCITYNHERFIRQAIEGFLMQETTFRVEILIHDDASTDHTTDIVREYENKFPGLVLPIYQSVNQYSQGIKPAPTFQYPRARGIYIALCDGDDYWTDALKLQKQIDFLEKNSEYVTCYHNVKVLDETGNIIMDSQLPDDQKKDASEMDLIMGLRWCKTASLCFRNVIRDVPSEFFHVLNLDTFLLSLLGHHGKGKWLGDKILPSVYRVHTKSIWSSMEAQEQQAAKVNTFLWIYNYYKRTTKKKYSEQWFERLIRILYSIDKRKYVSDAQWAAQLARLNAKLDERNAQLASIYSSKIWRLGLRLRRLRLWLAPPGSLQARMGGWILSIASKIRKI